MIANDQASKRDQIVHRLLNDDSLTKKKFLKLYVATYYSVDVWKHVPDEQFLNIFREGIRQTEAQRQKQISAAVKAAIQRDQENRIRETSGSSSPYSSGTSDSAMLSS